MSPPGSATLKKGVITLPGVLMQSVTSIAPAIAGMFTIPFIVLNAGIAAPLAYFGAFIIALLLGFSLSQFSKHLSSTGSYYTFVSRSLGGRWGFLVAWVYLLFYPVVIAQVGSFMGSTLQSTLKAEYNITFEWWWFMVFLILFVGYTAWRGVELSVSLLIVLGIFEALIVLALAINGFASPGPGGVNLHWSNFQQRARPVPRRGLRDLRDHRLGRGRAARRGERATRSAPFRGPCMGSILIMGVFLVLVSWGQTSGWGTNRLTSFASSAQLPAFVLGQRYWGGAWWIVLLALFNSAIAVSIACTNASTRFLYGMARAKALPSCLLKVNDRVQDPDERGAHPDRHQRRARPDPAARHRRRERLQRDRHLVHVRAGVRLHRGERRALRLLQAGARGRVQLAQARPGPGHRDSR